MKKSELHCFLQIYRFAKLSVIHIGSLSKKPKAGVLKVTDENTPYFGKYIGCNFTGVAIRRCLETQL